MLNMTAKGGGIAPMQMEKESRSLGSSSREGVITH